MNKKPDNLQKIFNDIFEEAFTNLVSGAENLKTIKKPFNGSIFTSVFPSAKKDVENPLNNTPMNEHHPIKDKLSFIEEQMLSSFNQSIRAILENSLKKVGSRDKLAKILTTVHMTSLFEEFSKKFEELIDLNFQESPKFITFQELNKILIPSDIEHLLNNNIIQIAQQAFKKNNVEIGEEIISNCFNYSLSHPVSTDLKGLFMKVNSLRPIVLGDKIGQNNLLDDSGFIPGKNNIDNMVDSNLTKAVNMIWNKYFDVLYQIIND